MKEKKKILVTGTAGFIGFYLIEKLLTLDQYQIIGLEREICNETGINLIDGLGDKIQSSSWLLK